jgi:hypothetical protein
MSADDDAKDFARRSLVAMAAALVQIHDRIQNGQFEKAAEGCRRLDDLLQAISNAQKEAEHPTPVNQDSPPL